MKKFWYLQYIVFLVFALAGLFFIFKSTEWGTVDAIKFYEMLNSQNITGIVESEYVLHSEIQNYKITGVLLFIVGSMALIKKKP